MGAQLGGIEAAGMGVYPLKLQLEVLGRELLGVLSLLAKPSDLLEWGVQA